MDLDKSIAKIRIIRSKRQKTSIYAVCAVGGKTNHPQVQDEVSHIIYMDAKFTAVHSIIVITDVCTLCDMAIHSMHYSLQDEDNNTLHTALLHI